MTREHKTGRLLLVLTMVAVLSLILGLGIQLGLSYWRYRRSWESLGSTWKQLESECLERTRQLREEQDIAYGGSRDTALETLTQRAKSKGRVQRSKHLELLLLVNPWNQVPEDYSPELAEVTSNYQIRSDYLIDARCASYLSDMLNDCLRNGGWPEVCSAYRTEDYQRMLFDNKIERLIDEGVSYEDAPELAATTVAVPGTSEHQLGLAVDIIDVEYPYLNEAQEWTWTQRWLMENSWRYGFILRYPNGTSGITGIIYEPWHYRYVGLGYARIIHDLDVTLEEYLAMRNGR